MIIPPVKEETCFLSPQGSKRNGLKDVTHLLLRRDGRMGFEGGYPRDQLIPRGFRTVSSDNLWLFERKEAFGMDSQHGFRLIRAVLEIFGVCGYQFPLTAWRKPEGNDLYIHWLGAEDVLAISIHPPLKPSLPAGTRILVNARSGEVSASYKVGSHRLAEVSHVVKTPFADVLNEQMEALWVNQVLDACAAAGVFVARQLERSLDGLVGTVRENTNVTFVPARPRAQTTYDCM